MAAIPLSLDYKATITTARLSLAYKSQRKTMKKKMETTRGTEEKKRWHKYCGEGVKIGKKTERGRWKGTEKQEHRGEGNNSNLNLFGLSLSSPFGVAPPSASHHIFFPLLQHPWRGRTSLRLCTDRKNSSKHCPPPQRRATVCSHQRQLKPTSTMTQPPFKTNEEKEEHETEVGRRRNTEKTEPPSNSIELAAPALARTDDRQVSLHFSSSSSSPGLFHCSRCMWTVENSPLFVFVYWVG